MKLNGLVLRPAWLRCIAYASRTRDWFAPFADGKRRVIEYPVDGCGTSSVSYRKWRESIALILVEGCRPSTRTPSPRSSQELVRLLRAWVPIVLPGNGTTACAYYIGALCTRERKSHIFHKAARVTPNRFGGR